jgi:hypothetical protein
MSQYQFGTEKKRMPAVAAAPAAFRRGGQMIRARSRNHDWLPAGAIHDFGRISIHAPGSRAELADDSACASGRFGKNGGTGCDTSTGKTVTNIYDPPACYRHCVERHEATHARDITPCCTRANTAYKAAKSDDDKQTVQDKFDKWMLSNQDWLECRAYTESAKCGKEYVDKNCGGKKQDAGSSRSVSGPEAQPTVSLEPQGASRTAPRSGEEEEVAPAKGSMLAEDKPDTGAKEKPDAGAEAPGPEQCCPKLLCYWRISQGRADNVCPDAPKTLSRCPF